MNIYFNELGKIKPRQQRQAATTLCVWKWTDAKSNYWNAFSHKEQQQQKISFRIRKKQQRQRSTHLIDSIALKCSSFEIIMRQKCTAQWHDIRRLLLLFLFTWISLSLRRALSIALINPTSSSCCIIGSSIHYFIDSRESMLGGCIRASFLVCWFFSSHWPIWK